jgi:hypothetical protein
MKIWLILVTVLSLTARTAWAEEYQFIISGDPVAAASADSSSLASVGVNMNSGGLSQPSIACSLDMRYRTWFASDGINLESSELHIGFRFILK